MRFINTSFLPLLILGASLHAQSLNLASPEFGYDSTQRLLLVRVTEDRIAYPLRSIQAGPLTFTLADSVSELRYDTSYAAVRSRGDTVAVAFTRLPLVTLHLPSGLDNENKQPVPFTYADDDQQLSATVGARYRGSYSLRFPKRSLDLEFWDDAESRKSVDVSFAGLREDDDWVLDALYNEPLRVNAYAAHKLWLEMHTPYYLVAEDDARSGADVTFVEVFLNDDYYGVYLLSEQVDRKQLKLKTFKDEEIRGELYKAVDWTGATLLASQPALPAAGKAEYAGWELKYPDTEDVIDWTRLHDLLGFVTTTDETAFAAEAANRFELDNIIDYFLFVNIAGLTDNTGKNTYLARYQQREPYFYVPWDLDAAFGNTYNGTRLTSTRFWVGNNLLTRLTDENPEAFTARLCDRYQQLRRTLLGTTELQDRLTTAHRYLSDNGVYAREQLVWPNVSYGADEVDFTKDFIAKRMAYLDTYVCQLATSITPTAGTPPVALFPNPASRQLTVRHGSSTALAYAVYSSDGRRVSSGVLQPLEDQLTVAELAPGIYLLRFADRIARFVVQR